MEKKDDKLVIAGQRDASLSPTRLFDEIVSESGSEQLMKERKKTERFLALGMLPSVTITDEMRTHFLSKVADALEMLGVNLPHFERIFVIRTELKPDGYALHPNVNWEYVNMGQWRWKYSYNNATRDSLPRFSLERFGVTNSCDDTWAAWRRRSVSDYIRDDNSLPRRVIDILEKLQNCGLPITVCPMVWSPMELTREDNKAGHIYTVTDSRNAGKGSPILVLEFSDENCIPLYAWNSSV